MKNWLMNNLILKMTSLGLAIMVWIYVNWATLAKNFSHILDR